jgi:hypothetical protein
MNVSFRLVRTAFQVRGLSRAYFPIVDRKVGDQDVC